MSEENEKEKSKGFKVTDRRMEEKSKEEPAKPEKEKEKAADESDYVNFASFVLSLSTSAMVHLGLTDNPVTKKNEEDLTVARQEIQIIEMLKEKTKGNLDDQEERLIEDVLFHLRMKYVEKAKG